MMDIRKKVERILPGRAKSDWKGYEHYYGYGMMILPFSSGHLLGFRVFPQNDFAPYKSLWRCDPKGNWSIYNDGQSPRATCPRWWGPALKHQSLRGFRLEWVDKNNIRIEMSNPVIVWQIELGAKPLLNVLNTPNAAMPNWKWTYPFQKKV
jgi:hypothetical protein